MKEINSRDFFDDSEAVISKVTSADALEEDSKPDTSDTEEEVWVPKASTSTNIQVLADIGFDGKRRTRINRIDGCQLKLNYLCVDNLIGIYPVHC